MSVALSATSTPGAWQTIVDANPGAVEFIIATGISRGQRIVLDNANNGAIFTLSTGADVRGCSVLSSWSGSGPYTHSFTTAFSTHGTCTTEYPMCNRRDQLYRDGEPLRQVSSTAELDFNTYHINYGTNTLTVSFNPSGYMMEIADTANFLDCSGTSADNVTVRGDAIIQRYATQNQAGVIDMRSVSASYCDGWHLYDGLQIEWNSGAGLEVSARPGGGMICEDIFVRNNGQLNIAGGGQAGALASGIDMNRVTVSGDNWKGVSNGWEGGGVKLVKTVGCTWRNGTFTDTGGPALWFDIDNVSPEIYRNNFRDCWGEAVKLEIGYGGRVRNNVIKRCAHKAFGYGYTRDIYVWWSAGIHVQNTRNVLVEDNDVYDCPLGIFGTQQNRGTGLYGEYEIDGLVVNNNRVYGETRSRTGANVNQAMVGVSGDYDLANVWNGTRPVTFTNNDYYNNDTAYFSWNGSSTNTFATWQGFGHDAAGSSNARTARTNNAIRFSRAASAGAIWTAPDSAQLSVIGDIDISAKVLVPDVAVSTRPVVSKWVTTGNQRSYSLRIESTGLLQFTWSPDGTAANAISHNSTATLGSVGIGDGDTFWIRVVLDVDDGSSNHVVKFYWSDEDHKVDETEVAWLLLGNEVTTAGVTSIYDGTASLELGSEDNGATDIEMSIKQLTVKNGVKGTIMAKWDFASPNKYDRGKTQITDNVNNIIMSLTSGSYLTS